MPLMARAIDHNFKWIALSDCRVAELSTDRYIKITLGILRATYLRVANAESARWGGLIGRYPGFLRFDLQARVAVALLELAREFGVQNTRGILIRITLSQRQLADLVGATRPRVGEVLADLERREIVVREGRRWWSSSSAIWRHPHRSEHAAFPHSAPPEVCASQQATTGRGWVMLGVVRGKRSSNRT